MTKPSGTKTVIYAALAGNLLVAVTKFIAFGISGSSAMLSEGVHSIVDTGNELLLLYGLRQSRVRPDRDHPLGHGRELYFWSFVVAVLVFALGAGVSLYEGIVHLSQPARLHDPTVNYVVLAFAFAFEGITWWVAVKALRATKGSLGYLEAIRQSKDPATFTVLLEDSAALIGLLIAFVGITSAQLFQQPQLDGVASIGIALVLAFTAVFLARETKGLLIGEPARKEVTTSIRQIAESDAAVAHVNELFTVQIGPDNVVASLNAEFQDHLTIPEIESIVNRLEDAIRFKHPEITALFVRPQTAEAWRRRRPALGEHQ